MRHDEYLRHDATALASLVARGEVSAAELLDLALAQLGRVQPRINAVVRSLEPQARAQLAGPLSGPLAGVPLLIKDVLQDYAGVPSGSGSRSMQHIVPSVHSAIVRRLLGAGAVIFGKTSLPEFGLKAVTDPQVHGRCSNPWDLGRTPGGSSGGSAAAVAAGVLPMASGNDGGGSIRIPAACCGLFGLKPSRGRVSQGPAVNEGWFGLVQDGVLSRSVRDTALALDILAGPEPGDPFVIAPPVEPYVQSVRQAPRRLRIGFSVASPIGTPVDAEAVAAVQGAARRLAALGHDVVEAAPAVDGWALARDYLQVYFGSVPAMLDWACAQGARRGDIEPLTRLAAAVGRATSAARLATALMGFNTYTRALGEFHRTHDLWLTPTLAAPPVPHGTGDPSPAQLVLLGLLERSGLIGLLARWGLLDGEIDRIARDNMAAVPFTQLANIAGVPAMSVPLHWTADGLPLGVQFVGRHGDEALLLQLAAQLEADAPWFDRLSPLARAG